MSQESNIYDVSIKFENSIGLINNTYLKGFRFVLDIYKFYAGARFTLSDLSRSEMNLISQGLDVTVTFSKKDKECVHRMKVFSVQKNPAPDTLLADDVDVTLISAWYFTQAIYSRAFSGSVSGVISEIFKKDFSKDDLKFLMTSSEDTPCIRYQLNTRSQAFINNLLSYSSYKNLPMYLYTDTSGAVNLRGLSEMISKEPQHIAAPYLADELDLIPQEDLQTLRRVVLNSWNFQNNSLSSNSTVTSFFTTSHFVSSSDIKVQTAIQNAETDNALVKSVTPERADYYPWYVTPSDAAAVSSRKVVEENLNVFQVNAVVPNFDLDNLNIGNVLKVILPYEGVATEKGRTTVGNGFYLITKLSFNYDTEGVKTTEVQMSQIGH